MTDDDGAVASGGGAALPDGGASGPDGVDLAFDEAGLLPAVAQDADSGEVLMLAYVDAGAVRATVETGLAHYYSRSRDERWQKGETSGHVQRVEEVRVDCDGDALLYLVDQTVGACHTGYRSCFHRTLDGAVVGERAFDPDEVYGDDDAADGGAAAEGDDGTADDGAAHDATD